MTVEVPGQAALGQQVGGGSEFALVREYGRDAVGAGGQVDPFDALGATRRKVETADRRERLRNEGLSDAPDGRAEQEGFDAEEPLINLAVRQAVEAKLWEEVEGAVRERVDAGSAAVWRRLARSFRSCVD